MAASPVAGPEDPLPLVLIVLSAVTGLVDAVSVLGLGQVFVANMTGNTVFLGFAVGGTPGFEVPRYVMALLTFLVGALAGGWIANAFVHSTRRRWLLTVAAVEAILFWAAAVVALEYDVENLSPASRLFTLIGLSALAMGLRNATVRRLKMPDLTTTVLTLTLTGLAADSSLSGGENKNWRRRIAAVVAIFVGAVIGAVLVRTSGLVVPLVVTGAIVLIVTIAYALHPASGATAGEPDGS
ncbi:YoaK family protein [Microvirga sp. G4-2]|uniref:YoaK family protein n=1 Tax=Microvirga sp. G4-2 TaxID=3434467 RepID=UPI004043DE30